LCTSLYGPNYLLAVLRNYLLAVLRLDVILLLISWLSRWWWRWLRVLLLRGRLLLLLGCSTVAAELAPLCYLCTTVTTVWHFLRAHWFTVIYKIIEKLGVFLTSVAIPSLVLFDPCKLAATISSGSIDNTVSYVPSSTHSLISLVLTMVQG